MSATTATDFNLSNESSLEQKVESLIEVVEQQSKRIDELEDTVDTLEEDRDRLSKELAQTNARVTELEDNSGNENPSSCSEESTIPDTETPLEDVVQLPENVVEGNLTANQERARFIAKGIDDYSKKVPAGFAIKSSELRKVLSAKEEGTVHTQTVSRVIDRLNKLGKDSVMVKETRSGERSVIFNEGIVRRILAYQDQNHGGVPASKVSG